MVKCSFLEIYDQFGHFYAHSGPKVPVCWPIHISMHLKFFNRIYKKCLALNYITSPTIIILTAEKLPKIKDILIQGL